MRVFLTALTLIASITDRLKESHNPPRLRWTPAGESVARLDRFEAAVAAIHIATAQPMSEMITAKC